MARLAQVTVTGGSVSDGRTGQGDLGRAGQSTDLNGNSSSPGPSASGHGSSPNRTQTSGGNTGSLTTGFNTTADLSRAWIGSRHIIVGAGDFDSFVNLNLAFALFCVSLFIWVRSTSFRIATARLLKETQEQGAFDERLYVAIFAGLMFLFWALRWLFSSDVQLGDDPFLLALMRPGPFVPLFAVLTVLVAGIAGVNFALSLPAARVLAARRKASVVNSSRPFVAFTGLCIAVINFVASLLTIYGFTPLHFK